MLLVCLNKSQSTEIKCKAFIKYSNYYSQTILAHVSCCDTDRRMQRIERKLIFVELPLNAHYLHST